MRYAESSTSKIMASLLKRKNKIARSTHIFIRTNLVYSLILFVLKFFLYDDQHLVFNMGMLESVLALLILYNFLFNCIFS
ncbi:uncharacterized protein DS421_16g538260 [Arachis hypogaea]|nr:uncharacterized protein DS421_16g538260 [Arachis hypogaea]